MPRWAVLVIEKDGVSEYVRSGQDDSGPIASYASRAAADRQAEFWRDGLGDEVQSVNVVPYPTKAKER